MNGIPLQIASMVKAKVKFVKLVIKLQAGNAHKRKLMKIPMQVNERSK